MVPSVVLAFEITVSGIKYLLSPIHSVTLKGFVLNSVGCSYKADLVFLGGKGIS